MEGLKIDIPIPEEFKRSIVIGSTEEIRIKSGSFIAPVPTPEESKENMSLGVKNAEEKEEPVNIEYELVEDPKKT